MEPIPQKQPCPGLPWTLRNAGGDACPATWERLEAELNRLHPGHDSFVILEQEDDDGFWYIQSAVALAGPHTGQFIVGCGWSGAEGPTTPGGIALVEWYGGYADAVALFRNVWENHTVDFTGFEDQSHLIPVNRRKELLGITRLEVGMLGTNCYILKENKANLLAVIDPGADPERIIAEVRKQGGNLKYILLTHGHYDHVDALPEIAAAFPEAEIYIHRRDVKDVDRHLFHVGGMLKDPKCPVTRLHYFKAFNDWDVPTPEARQLPFGDLVIHPIHTPGHSEGSVTLRISGGPLFCGDTLFEGSCGRTDFPGGNVRKMMASLRLFGMMEGDAAVYPGHMMPTSLEAERKSNPYLRQAMQETP